MKKNYESWGGKKLVLAPKKYVAQNTYIICGIVLSCWLLLCLPKCSLWLKVTIFFMLFFILAHFHFLLSYCIYLRFLRVVWWHLLLDSLSLLCRFISQNFFTLPHQLCFEPHFICLFLSISSLSDLLMLYGCPLCVSDHSTCEDRPLRRKSRLCLTNQV